MKMPLTARRFSASEMRSRVRHFLPRTSRSFWAAWTLWAVIVGTMAVSMGYGAGHQPPPSVADGGGGNNVVGATFITVFASMGALLAWKRSKNPIGWPLCLPGGCYALAGAGPFLADFRPTQTLGLWLGWAW